MKSLKTCDGYVFFSSPEGWVDFLKLDGTPNQNDMMVPYETFEEWNEEGDATEYKWSGEWVQLNEGPFDSQEEASAYRHAEVARHMPTRIRSVVSGADSKTKWFIDTMVEVDDDGIPLPGPLPFPDDWPPQMLTDDQKHCHDCGRVVEWNEDEHNWLHLGENRGCFLDQRNSVLPMPTDKTEGGE